MAEVYPRVFKFGLTSIEVQSADFKRGYNEGVFAFINIEGPYLTFEHLYELIARCFLDITHSAEWNTGYLAGAFHSLRILSNGQPPSEAEEQENVQLNSHFTLCLNRWRFAEGYHEGRKLFLERFAADPARLLRSDELLNAVAHYHPRTDSFFLSPSEILLAEMMLGQLIGLFCAGLFPAQRPIFRPFAPVVTYPWQ
jgi:hypothetical protein